MKEPIKYVVGIDPGFGQAGLVLRKLYDPSPLAWFTWTAGTGDEFMRAMAMGSAIVDGMVTLTEEFSMENSAVAIAVEMHVWKSNASTYRMQSRLLEEIESGLYFVVEPLVRELWLVEHGPGTAKRLATGDGRASKLDVIGAFRRVLCDEELAHIAKTGNSDTMHTLADSWAHSLAANAAFISDFEGSELYNEELLDVVTLRRLTSMQPHHIKAIAEGRKHE